MFHYQSVLPFFCYRFRRKLDFHSAFHSSLEIIIIIIITIMSDNQGLLQIFS